MPIVINNIVMQNSPSIMRERSYNRRDFLKASTLMGTALLGAPGLLRAQAERRKLNVACIGTDGKGKSDTVGVQSERIIALCDPDRRLLDKHLKE